MMQLAQLLRLRKRSAVAVVCSLGLAAAVAPTITHADPAGCATYTPTLTVVDGSLQAQANATCTTAQTRTLRLEIKQDVFGPDPVTATSSDRGTKQDYDVSINTCDHGNDSTYYARAFFEGTTDYHDSEHQDVQTC